MSSLSLRGHLTANLAAANAAKKKAVEEKNGDKLTVISDLTPQTAYTRSTIRIQYNRQLHCHLVPASLKKVVVRSLWKSSRKET